MMGGCFLELFKKGLLLNILQFRIDLQDDCVKWDAVLAGEDASARAEQPAGAMPLRSILPSAAGGDGGRGAAPGSSRTTGNCSTVSSNYLSCRRFFAVQG